MPSRAPDAGLRRRVALLAGALTLGVTASVAVPALASDREDELAERKAGVNDSLQSANGDLSEVSADLIAADKALNSAQTQLVAAQQVLARTRGELAVARALDEKMQAELVDAEAELDAAVEAVEETESDIEVRREQIGEMVADNFQYGSPALANLGSVLEGSDPADIGETLTLADSVLNSQTSALDELTATETVLVGQQERITELRDEVALKREAAAENLDVKAELTRAAEEQTSAVAAIVATRKEAQQRAANARQVELDRIAALEARREQIKTRLQEVARREAEAARRAAAREAARTGTPAPPPSAPSSGGAMSWPVQNTYITSPYGMRLHPILNVYKLHDGTDFGAGCGTPIYAAASGTVASAYYDSAYGNRVLVSHGLLGGRSVATSYNHMTSDAVSVGQRVSKGQVIGYAGTTGYSTGCHLHFMVYENGSTVDPMGWLG